MNRVFAWPVGQGRFVLPLRYSMLYAAAATIGGLLAGTVLAGLVAALALLPPAALGSGAALLCFTAVALQITGRLGPLPERRRQVPDGWLQLAPSRYAVGFGAMLGFGALTHLTHAVVYCVLAVLVVQGDPALAVVVGGTYGLARGLGPLLARALVRTPASAARYEAYIASDGFAVRSRIVLAALGALLLVAVLQAGGP
jgi:hypothetical protein